MNVCINPKATSFALGLEEHTFLYCNNDGNLEAGVARVDSNGIQADAKKFLERFGLNPKFSWKIDLLVSNQCETYQTTLGYFPAIEYAYHHLFNLQNHPDFLPQIPSFSHANSFCDRQAIEGACLYSKDNRSGEFLTNLFPGGRETRVARANEIIELAKNAASEFLALQSDDEKAVVALTRTRIDEVDGRASHFSSLAHKLTHYLTTAEFLLDGNSPELAKAKTLQAQVEAELSRVQKLLTDRIVAIWKLEDLTFAHQKCFSIGGIAGGCSDSRSMITVYSSYVIERSLNGRKLSHGNNYTNTVDSKGYEVAQRALNDSVYKKALRVMPEFAKQMAALKRDFPKFYDSTNIFLLEDMKRYLGNQDLYMKFIISCDESGLGDGCDWNNKPVTLGPILEKDKQI